MIITRLAIIIILFFSTNIFAQEHISNWKIQKIEKPMRIPSDIAFYNENNEKKYIEDFEGKTLLIVFWATWCAPCLQEMVELDALKKDFRKLPLDILPISQDYQGVAIVKEFYKKNEIRHLPIYLDYKNEIFREMRMVGLPTCYIVDADGLIKAIITGTISWYDESLREVLLEYIGGNQVMPINSYRDHSLNQQIKMPKLEESKVQEAPKAKEVKQEENQIPTKTTKKTKE